MNIYRSFRRWGNSPMTTPEVLSSRFILVASLLTFEMYMLWPWISA